MTKNIKKEDLNVHNNDLISEINQEDYKVLINKFNKVQNINQLINLQLDYRHVPEQIILGLIKENIKKFDMTMEDFLLKNLELLSPKLRDNNKNIIKFIELLGEENSINLEKIVVKSCEVNNLDVLSFFMENKKYNNIINADNPNIQEGYFTACKKGHLPIVEYLLRSPKLDKKISLYINDGQSLVEAKYQNQLIEFFIIGLNMERTERVEKVLKNHNGCYAQKLFNIRDRYKNFKDKYVDNKIDSQSIKQNSLKP